MGGKYLMSYTLIALMSAALTACGGGGSGGGNNGQQASEVQNDAGNNGGNSGENDGGAASNVFTVHNNNLVVRFMAGSFNTPSMSDPGGWINQHPMSYSLSGADYFKQDPVTLAMTYIPPSITLVGAYTYSGATEEVSGNSYFTQGRWTDGSLKISSNPMLDGNYTLDGQLQGVSYLLYSAPSTLPASGTLACAPAVATTATVGGYNSANLGPSNATSWARLPNTAKTSGTASVTFSPSGATFSMNLLVDAGPASAQFHNLTPAAPITDGTDPGMFTQGDQFSRAYIAGSAGIGDAGNGAYLLALWYFTSIRDQLASVDGYPEQVAYTGGKNYSGTAYFICKQEVGT
jgi:hypothetical protein